MANKRISELPVLTTPESANPMAIVNGGETKQISLANLSDFINSNSVANLGFIVRPRPILQNVLLPEDSDVLYFGPLMMGVGYTLTVPITTTLTIE
jgi:hypothetical protein